MTADDQMARDHREDMRAERVLRELDNAIADTLICARLKGTRLAEDLEAIRETVGEYRARIVRTWD